MDIIFKCPHCEQELSVAESGAGTEIECPTCSQSIVIPYANHRDASPRPMPVGAATTTNAARLEEKHFVVPQHQKPASELISKALRPLDVAAKEGLQLHLKTIRHSECVEVGKDHFDEVVTKFLNKVGQANIISINPISYAHQDLGSREWVNDYGVMIVYKTDAA
jgi:DNA-directed RNA polymerase subunit RPC12/RpoP